MNQRIFWGKLIILTRFLEINQVQASHILMILIRFLINPNIKIFIFPSIKIAKLHILQNLNGENSPKPNVNNKQ